MTASRKRLEDNNHRKIEAERRERREHLGTVIRSVRGDTTQFELAQRISALRGEPFLQTSVSRWEKGMVDLSVEQIRDVELALDLEPGSILVAAGFVTTSADVALALHSDPKVHPDFRVEMVRIYNAFVAASKQLNSAGAKRRPAAKAAVG
jgi:hypothetical protein